MAKILASDLVNFYDFGLAADPASPNTTYRMYYDKTNNFLRIVDADFNIVYSYQGYAGTLITTPAPVPPATLNKITKTDICVLNDDGLNALPANGNSIYRMYLAEGRNIVITVSGGEFPVTIETDCALLIVNQAFQIEHIIPLVSSSLPLPTLDTPYLTCTYDYGLNAEAASGNYIWHMYIADYNTGEGIAANALCIVNQDFKVTCYASQPLIG